MLEPLPLWLLLSAALWRYKLLNGRGFVGLEEKLVGLFRGLPPEVLGDLKGLWAVSSYPSGARLFEEGEEPRGLFILLSGSAKLIMRSRERKNFAVRLAHAGETLGASSVIAKTPYLAAAEIMEPAEVAFVPMSVFLRFLATHPGASLWLAEQVSLELHSALARMRLLALPRSATARFAGFLLLWAREQGQKTQEGVRVPLSLSQRELSEATGAARETVSRVMMDLQRRGLIRIERHSILLLRWSALEGLLSARS